MPEEFAHYKLNQKDIAERDTDELSAISEGQETRRVRRFKNELAVITNVFIQRSAALGTTHWIETPDTHGPARCKSFRPSARPGWMIVDCNTIKGDMVLEVSAFWPITVRFQIR